ncbi:MAG: hypothetical protein ACO277_10045, partial [Ilumatobacteraceae bacterium]
MATLLPGPDIIRFSHPFGIPNGNRCGPCPDRVRHSEHSPDNHLLDGVEAQLEVGEDVLDRL